MPTPCYLSIEGERQGLISAGAFTEDSVGNIYQDEHADQILVQSVSHAMTVPTDPQSGQPAGQRVHGPLTITKVLDKSSPLLATALTTGEKMTTCELHWYRTSTTGHQEHYFTTKLTDAIIVNLSTTMPNAQDPINKHYTHLETVSFSYRKIEWTHEACGTSGEDDWRKPVAA
ncbi:MAG: Hcp family type VI secretion system effector [Desulfobacteraceae bacterium]|nr:Hcp family type VI secretion system effector [Desulfobacteraceae bacterium]